MLNAREREVTDEKDEAKAKRESSMYTTAIACGVLYLQMQFSQTRGTLETRANSVATPIHNNRRAHNSRLIHVPLLLQLAGGANLTTIYSGPVLGLGTKHR